MAEDYTVKRRDMATRAVTAATQLIDAVNLLVNLGPKLAQSGGGFEDADFEGTGLSHLNSWKMNTLVNVVAPALVVAAATPLDTETAMTHKDVLLAVASG
jgi:hypothetical protein